MVLIRCRVLDSIATESTYRVCTVVVKPTLSVRSTLQVIIAKIRDVPVVADVRDADIHRFLDENEVLYRGRNGIRDTSRSELLQLLFLEVFSCEDGEEFLVRRKTKLWAHDSILGGVTTSPNSTRTSLDVDARRRTKKEDGEVLHETKVASSPSIRQPRGDSSSGDVHPLSMISLAKSRPPQRAFTQFLDCVSMTWFTAFAAKEGIVSLGELCCYPAVALARIIRSATPPLQFMRQIATAMRGQQQADDSARGDDTADVTLPLEVLAHRLVDFAHHCMHQLGLVIDWPHRLRTFVKRVDPQRAAGSDILATAQHEMRNTLHHPGGSNLSPATTMRSSGGVSNTAASCNTVVFDTDELDAFMEGFWLRLRDQYEEHLRKTVDDIERRGYQLYPPKPRWEDAVAHGSGMVNDEVMMSPPLRALRDAVTAASSFETEEFLLGCPSCKHTFRYAPPSLAWRLQDLRVSIEDREREMMAEAKLAQLRIKELMEGIEAQRRHQVALESTNQQLESLVKTQRERIKILEAANEGLRRVPGTAVGGNKTVGVSSSPPDELSAIQREEIIHSNIQSFFALPPDAAVTAADRRRIRRVLVDYLERHNPDGILMADVIMHSWKDREYELERVLRLPQSRIDPLNLKSVEA